MNASIAALNAVYGAALRHRADALDRREVDDAAPAALLHTREHRVARRKHVQQVDAVERVPAGLVGLLERARRARGADRAR